MGYTNSSLIGCTIKSPNHSGTRTHTIDRITPHCVVGQLTAESIGSIFTPTSRKASCNYAIGKDGKIVLVVDEANRSWCSSSSANDQRAITIECASDLTAPYAFNNTVYNKLIELCTDICKRNGKKKLLWLGDKNTALNYTPAADEMVLTAHRWFSNTACPGDWMYGKLGDLATKVTAKLNAATVSTSAEAKTSSSTKAATTTTQSSTAASSYKVKVTASALNIRKGPGTKYAITGVIKDKGTYTITKTSGTWGYLKSGKGWISLNYTKKV